jgi:hypothetical protein
MDIVELIDKTGRIVNIEQRRRAKIRRTNVEYRYRLTAAIGMDSFVSKIEVVFRILAVKHLLAGCLGNDVFDQRAWKMQPIVIVEPATSFKCFLFDLGDRVSYTNPLEYVERRVMHELYF